jgi:hypothetical protein
MYTSRHILSVALKFGSFCSASPVAVCVSINQIQKATSVKQTEACCHNTNDMKEGLTAFLFFQALTTWST